MDLEFLGKEGDCDIKPVWLTQEKLKTVTVSSMSSHF